MLCAHERGRSRFVLESFGQITDELDFHPECAKLAGRAVARAETSLVVAILETLTEAMGL